MAHSPSYLEDADSQIPALRMLQAMGYNYLSPEQALELRDGLLSKFVLEEVLVDQLRELNEIEYKGETYDFPDNTFERASRDLQQVLDEGLVNTNEAIYDLLTLGKSYEQIIQGDKKSFPFKYVDWENPENNVYHVTDEFEIKGKHKTRRIDIVLFVNGIPFCAIECKRRDKKDAVSDAISQHIRNQKPEEVPAFFHYTQLLVATSVNELSYAATGTSKPFWSIWREEDEEVEKVKGLTSKPDDKENWKNRLQKHYETDPKETEDPREPTLQDKNLYNLCRPERLLELTRKFTVFDNNVRKVARYQQYFGVKRMMSRIRQKDDEGRREGGVIWHTQGSGKSITMIMMSKNLTLADDLDNHRIILVTDRTDLDEQLTNTFKSCGKEITRAKTGKHLGKLVEDRGKQNISTIINKFDAALNQRTFKNESKNIFVLVDESHRTQYGLMHAKMKKVLPNACYIGFTGTPLTKNEKNTARKFGGIIDSYTMDQAVEDGAVVPIIYEGRAAILDTWKEKLDRGFERDMEGMTNEQKVEYKNRFSTLNKLLTAQHVIEEIANDITQHYQKLYQGTKYKAQLAVPDRRTAVKYYRYFKERGQINAELVISPPDTRVGNDDIYDDPNDEVQVFWQNMMDRFQNKDDYEKSLVNLFKSDGEEVELLIVVYKLLTGFDAPRNTVLYMARYLEEHNLLQAIARVNRLFEGKDFGYVLDYRGILGTLNDALNTYQALDSFEQEDLQGAVTPIQDIIDKLPQLYSELWGVFKECENTDDKEALEQFLRPQDRRDTFYEKLSNFARTLQAAFSANRLFDHIDEETINKYKQDLKFFEDLRRSVRLRYSESIDHREYEDRVQKLLDSYVGTEGIEQIIEPVNIFSKDFSDEQLDKEQKTDASKADRIASNTKKVITEKMDEDPALYRKFSDMIHETIQKFLDERISEKEYLEKMKEIKKGVQEGTMGNTPSKLRDKPQARSFYNTVKDEFDSYITNAKLKNSNGNIQPRKLKQMYIEAGLDLDEKLDELAIVDWTTNPDIKDEMFIAIEDYMIEFFRELDLNRDFDVIERIAETLIKQKQSRSSN
ncbi:type I restriction endonuclease subunit R [Halalkalibaculum sp. DA3122]|uniref:type I restriction endonuclease subunit R n=1 Tax=Halalkalibaculum sp. DA3122 TaxID=3373607 RepID=UPI0037544BCD